MTAVQASSIPWHVRVVFQGRDGRDTCEYLVEFNVVGMDGPAAVIINSEVCRNTPVIAERRARGGLDLPDRLLDQLAIKSFRIVRHSIIEYGGDSGSWTAGDITRWIHAQWNADDAAQLIREFSRHVKPGLKVRDIIVTADDDCI